MFPGIHLIIQVEYSNYISRHCKSKQLANKWSYEMRLFHRSSLSALRSLEKIENKLQALFEKISTRSIHLRSTRTEYCFSAIIGLRREEKIEKP
jgi:hypothetical protein